jgi:hypothetical protein
VKHLEREHGLWSWNSTVVARHSDPNHFAFGIVLASLNALFISGTAERIAVTEHLCWVLSTSAGGTAPKIDQDKAARLVAIAERIRGIYERATNARLEFTKFVAKARELLGSDEELLA